MIAAFRDFRWRYFLWRWGRAVAADRRRVLR